MCLFALINIKRYRINNYIRVPQVRLINEKDEQIGIVDIQKALEMAREKQLDLIEISPNAQPPVCKLLNFGKFLYRIAKQERRHKAKQKKSEMKGVRIGIGTGKHDLEVKAKKASGFLDEGHQLKVEIILRGREKAHKDLATRKLKDFATILSCATKIIQEPKKFPLGFSMILTKLQ
jgi:translation initiation factor IF-3